MNKAKGRMPWVIRIAGVCTAVVIVGVGAGVAATAGPAPHLSGKAAVATVASKNWISDGEGSVKPQAGSVGPTAPRLPLTQSDTGPLVTGLQVLIKDFLPTDFSVVSTAEYSSVGAATIVLRSGGLEYSFALQKLSRQLPLDAITGGSASDTLTATSAGTQIVTVEHLLPAVSQIVLVRPGGAMLTVTVSPVAGASAPASDLRVSSVVSPGVLREQLLAKLDNSSLDTAANSK